MRTFYINFRLVTIKGEFKFKEKKEKRWDRPKTQNIHLYNKIRINRFRNGWETS